VQRAELEFAVLRQDTADIARFEQAIEDCVATYEQARRNQNSTYYDAIDFYTTTIVIILNRRSVDAPITLVNMKGIYFGVTMFEAEKGDDYYLIVKASGPWSVKLD